MELGKEFVLIEEVDEVLELLLTHLMGNALSAEPVRLPESRAPPQAGFVRLTLGKPGTQLK